MRILIADDHDLLRDTLALFFQAQSDIETYVASDLPSACKMIENDPPYDLVLLDLNMPGMNGLEGLKHALSLKGGQRVARRRRDIRGAGALRIQRDAGGN